MNASFFQKIFLPALLICIGLLTTLGHVVDYRPLFLIGTATAASPLPLPFTDAKRKQESFAHAYQITIETSDGNTFIIPGASEFLSGPHKRKIPYFASVVRSVQNNDLVQGALQHLFCDKKNYNTASFQLHTNMENLQISRLAIRTIVHTPDVDEVLLKTIVCQN